MLVWGLPRTSPHFSTLQKEMKLISGSKVKKKNNKTQKTEREKNTYNHHHYLLVCSISHTAWVRTHSPAFQVHRITLLELVIYPTASFLLFPTSFQEDLPSIHEVAFEELILNAFPTFYDGETWSADDQTKSGLSFPTASLRRLKDTNGRVLTLNKAFSIKMD